MQSVKISWVKMKAGVTSPLGMNLVIGGLEGGHPMYVARAHYDNNALIPGKLSPDFKNAYIALHKEHVKKEYEVLTCPPGALSWVRTNGSNIPDHAVYGGTDPGGEVLYIGRASIKGALVCGKVCPSSGICYLPYAGEQFQTTTYETLVRNDYGLALQV